MTKCPTCDSPDPMRHPAVQWEGEVQVCPDLFHRLTADTITVELIKSERDAGRIDFDLANAAIYSPENAMGHRTALARCALAINEARRAQRQ